MLSSGTRVAGHRSLDPASIGPFTPFVIVVLSYFVSAQRSGSAAARSAVRCAKLDDAQ